MTGVVVVVRWLTFGRMIRGGSHEMRVYDRVGGSEVGSRLGVVEGKWEGYMPPSHPS